MPYPFRILKNERVSASAQDVETFIRHALGQHLYIVEKQNLDETGKRFELHFWQRHIGLDNYMENGKIGKIYWGGAEIIEWSESTEIVRMWAATPDDWYLGTFNLEKDKVTEERFGNLEELCDEILEHFEHSVSKNKEQVSVVTYDVQGDFVSGDKTISSQNISISNSTVQGNIVASENIQESFNVIAEANIKNDLKNLLQQLTQAVEIMIQELPNDIAEEVADDMKRLAEEATKPSPNKKWYSVSIEGLTKAAENIGKVGEPVIKLAGKVLALLPGKGIA